MAYYDTIDEDLKRAKRILSDGAEDYIVPNAGPDGKDYVIHGRTIFAADTFAAYKLLESFVQEIERLHSCTGSCEDNYCPIHGIGNTK